MIGGLHGNWALFLLLYAVLLAVAIAAHVIWVWRIARDIRRSNHHISYKMVLTILLVLTPVVSFYAFSVMRCVRVHPHGARLGMHDLVMSVTGASTVLACAFAQTMNYSPDFRTWQALLGFIPGFLAFYGVIQLIFYMTVSVFGLSQRDFLSSRTHLISAAILLATGVIIR